MSTSELVLSKTFYPESVVDKAIEDFKDDVFIEKSDNGNGFRLKFSTLDDNMKEEFANYCLALYKNGIN